MFSLPNDGEVAFEWTVTDCDRNGVADLHDLARGAGDADGDGRFEACE